MRPTPKLLVIVLVLLLCSPTLGDKAEALAKIDSLIESGHLDQAKKLIDHLLAHNPEDADLKRLFEKWKVRKGDLGALKTDLDLGKPENRERLRDACFLVVTATMGGNPEEWAALLDVGDDTRAEAILNARTSHGSEEDRRTAKAILNPLPIEEPTVEELIADVKRGPDSCREALRLAAMRKERKLKPYAKKIFAADTTLELRIAAAGLLLALGDDSPRKFLLQTLEADRPADAVAAARVLVRRPAAPLTKLFTAVTENERILRAKPQILEEILAGIGDWRDGEGKPTPGARKFLTGLLVSPQHHIDAARALGALHDPEAVSPLLGYLRKPLPEDEDAAAGGLGFLGRGTNAHAEVQEAEELRPILVGVIALLRATAP